VVPSMALWYPGLNPVVGRFGTNRELDLGNGTIMSHFRFMAGYHTVTLLGSD